ncbi:uncharacterized protein LOC100179265 [Ciona intestinalis]
MIAAYNSLNEQQRFDEVRLVDDVTDTSHDTPLVDKKHHGIMCIVLKKLHLKKKYKESEISAKTKTRKKKSFWKKADKSGNDVKMTHNDKDRLIGESKESLPHLNADEYTYRGKRVDFAQLPDKYELLEENVCDVISSFNDSGIHDESICSSDDEERTDDVIRLHDDVKQRTFSDYVSKQWKGRRAKRTRKAIRRTGRNVIKALQVGIQTPFSFMDASSLATAYHGNRGR